MIKKLLGLQPKLAEEGAYTPSPLSLMLATSRVTDYEEVPFPNRLDENKYKILVICTEQSRLLMKNKKVFSTGNHPVETIVPMLHLSNAGFGFEIYTPTGKPVQMEMWAMPDKDKHVMHIYEKYKSQFEQPQNLAKLAENNFISTRKYAAIYFPGGHGALLGLPDDKNVGKLIKWAYYNDLFHLSICHGPAALLAAKPETTDETYIFKGYKIAAFPDAVDRQTPLIGYMPGQLMWFFGERLKKLGITIVNKKADKTCMADKKLITAASPKAANSFGILAATKMLEDLNRTTT